ncbi:MAG: glycerol-3-phosphate 1-O-acyltransferase PlsY [Synergistaceae bacterium]|nr:glycerol-3-phosphate 1-O-acyltransferase PlsY [Synergistaceae bacterium]
MGEDIRKFGSGNIGATNVSRVLGRKWAVLTAVCDMFKGGFAVLVAMAFGVRSPVVLSLIGISGVLGHDFPLWLGFHGGKGVSTSFGVFGCFDFFNPMPAILGGVVWFVVREATLYSSLASMTALVVSSLLMPLFMMDRAYYVSGLLLSALSIWQHRENIMRLISGTENKLKPLLNRETDQR